MNNIVVRFMGVTVTNLQVSLGTEADSELKITQPYTVQVIDHTTL